LLTVIAAVLAATPFIEFTLISDIINYKEIPQE